MADRKASNTQEYAALKTAIEALNKSVDSIAVKLDGVTSIAMSMSNEIARLDERVTFALDQQKGQAVEMGDIKRRISALEGYDKTDSKIKEIVARIFLIVISAVISAAAVYLFTPH